VVFKYNNEEMADKTGTYTWMYKLERYPETPDKRDSILKYRTVEFHLRGFCLASKVPETPF